MTTTTTAVVVICYAVARSRPPGLPNPVDSTQICTSVVETEPEVISHDTIDSYCRCLWMVTTVKSEPLLTDNNIVSTDSKHDFRLSITLHYIEIFNVA